MKQQKYLNNNRNSLIISTLHNSNNMKTTQLADNQQINLAQRQLNSDIIDSIIWFGLNYNYNFIDKCWSDDPCLANHLKDKFSICTEGLHKMSNVNSRIRYGVMTRFITMLDNANREKLYKYILSIYSKQYGFWDQD